MARKDTTTIHHNPRCGKSRDTLAIIKERGIEPTIVEYLKTPPTKDDLRSILEKMRMRPEQIVRKSEDAYQDKFANKALSDGPWLDVLAGHPILIERPIVVKGGRAGMPPAVRPRSQRFLRTRNPCGNNTQRARMLNCAKGSSGHGTVCCAWPFLHRAGIAARHSVNESIGGKKNEKS